MANKWGKKWKQWQILFSWAPKSLWMVTAAMKFRDICSLEDSESHSVGPNSFVTPWTIESMEFSRSAYWSVFPFPSPADLPYLCYFAIFLIIRELEECLGHDRNTINNTVHWMEGIYLYSWIFWDVVGPGKKLSISGRKSNVFYEQWKYSETSIFRLWTESIFHLCSIYLKMIDTVLTL